MKAVIQNSINSQTSKPEDETSKRNTDCVYFLASPLTCKKGSECEYRHSENARMNPRDCWYWMNGNCLNLKCSFRHPPLDGLSGTPPLGPKQLAAAQNPASTMGKQGNSHKQATPCYYFQNGNCLKGDLCPFIHEQLSFGNSVSQSPATKVPIFVSEPQMPKKPTMSLQRCNTQQQNLHQGNIIKPVQEQSAAKVHGKPENSLSRNGMVDKRVNDVIPRYKPTNLPPVTSGDSVSRTHRSRQAYPSNYASFPNRREQGEYFAESSPGFDVLVENDLWGSDNYQNEDEYGRVASREGRHVNAANNIGHKRSSDYNPSDKFDQETYNQSRVYDSYEWAQDNRVQELRRPSSERISESTVLLERREYSRAESPTDQVDASDLRYRLKHRKVNGSRSAISPGPRGILSRRDDFDPIARDHRERDNSRRDSHRSVPREVSQLSNRLQGRIKLPRRSSPDHCNDFHQERELNRERIRGRLSPPGRLPTSSYQGRLPDRIKERTFEDFSTEGRNLREPPIKKNEADNYTLSFSGPKSLAELKGSKVDDNSHKNTETRKLVNYQESEGSYSFEGPKPLNLLLKRKREAGTMGSVDDTVFGDEEELNQRRKGEPRLIRPRTSEVAEKQNEVVFGSNIEEAQISKEEVEEEEGLISAEGDVVTHETYSVQKESELQEEAEMVTEKLEQQEFESLDQRDGESDYELVEGGGDDLKAEEDYTNIEEAEDEFSDDDEDGDDFAKKIGKMFS